MKQSDYAIHRPLNEFSFNFTDWDEKLDEIVAAIPSDAIWDDIHSVWLNKAKPLLADYNSINRWQEPVEFYGRVAKKFGLKRMLRPDGGVAVVTDEGYRGEMFGNEKLAKQLNDKCLLPPNLAAKFGITPKDCSKAEEPELEPEPEEKPKAELPIVQRPAEDDTTTVSATTTASEPVADRAEDDGCPQFFMARSGLKFQIYLSEPNKETGDPYFDKEFSFDEARKIVSGLNNNIDCSISSDEAVSNAISAVPALLAAGLVGRKNRPQGGKLKPEGGKNQLKPEGGKTRLHQGTSWNYDPNAEREVRNRQRLRAAQGRRSFTPDDLANQKTRMSNATRNRARAGRGRANPEEINRRTQDFDTRQKQRARYDTRSGRNRSSNPEEITRRDQDITKRRLQQKWAKADPSQFRQRPKTNTPTKTASASTPKSFVNEPDPAANNWKKHKVGDRVRRTPVSRKAQNFLKKPNENPFSKFDDTSASKNTPIKFDDKSPGRSTVRNIGSHGADTLHPEERVSKRSVPDPAKQGQNFLKKPDENPFSKFDDTSASKNTPIKFDDKPPGRSTVEPDRAKQGRDFLKRQPENPFSRFDDTPASKNTPIKWDDNGPGTSTVKKPKSPPVPPTPEPNSLMSRPVPTGGDPPEIKNDGPLQIPQNQKPDNPPPVDPPKLRNPERFGKLEIDLTTKDPLKTLQGIDVNDMPNLPEIKYNQLHNNLIRMLDTAADPPGGSLQNYLDNLKRDLLSRGVNAQALDTMTDLSKLYVKKLNIGKLGSTEISDLKHLTAALMSNNSSYSKWLDSLKDVKIDMETGLPKANANGDLTPANKGSKASEMPSSVKDIDKWKKSGNSFTPTTLEDFLKSQKITKNTIPFELLDPDAVKTSTLLDAFGFPKDTRLASTLTTDAASEALEKLAIGKLPVQNFPLEAIEGSASMWKDKKTLRQFTSAFQGSTLDLDKLDRAIAYAMTIKPEIDKLPPKETTYNDPFDKLENSLDNDATAKAIRDRAQRQLQDIEAEMNAAEEETNAERRAAKKAEIDAKLEKQRADARAALEAEESKLTDAQRKAHEAHIEAIDKLKAQQAISDRMAANQPTNRKVPGGEFGSSYEASLSAAQNAEIAKKQEQLVAMRKHEQVLTNLMRDAEASSMQAYEEYKKTIAAEQTAREKYIKDIQEIGAKGREEAAMARRKAAYENEMLKIQADTNKAAEAYWQSVQNSPNSENLQRSVEKEMRDAKTFPGTTATAPDGTKSAAQTTQANQNFSDIQQQKLAEPDPPPKFNGPKQLTPEPSTPAAEIEAQAEKIRNMSNQSPPSSTQTKKTVGDKRMVNGDEYEWLGNQWRNNTTGKIATTTVAQQLNSMSGQGPSAMAGTTQNAIKNASPGELIPVTDESKNTWNEFREERKGIDNRMSGGDFKERMSKLTPEERAAAERLGIKDAKELDEFEGGKDEQKKIENAKAKATQKIEAQRKEIEAGADSDSLEKQRKAEVLKKAFAGKSSAEIAERIAKGMTKELAVSVAKKLGLGVVAIATGGWGLIVWAFDLLDYYDFLALFMAAGWIDDTNDELMALREEDVDKIDEYLRRTDVSKEDKVAFVKRMTAYSSVPMWNPKFWLGGLEQYKKDFSGFAGLGGLAFNNKWAKENMFGEDYGGSGYAITTYKPDLFTGAPVPSEVPLTPFNVHKLNVARDVPKQPRTSGDIKNFQSMLEGMANTLKEGPYYFLNVDKKGRLKLMAKDFDDIRDAPNNKIFAGGIPRNIGTQGELYAEPGAYDHRIIGSRKYTDQRMIGAVRITNTHNILKGLVKNYSGYFLIDNKEQVMKNIQDPNDKKYVEELYSGKVAGVIGVKVAQVRYLASEAEKQYNRSNQIDHSLYKDERADAQEEYTLRRLATGHYKPVEEARKIILYRKMKNLTERLNTYRNAKYFIIGS